MKNEGLLRIAIGSLPFVEMIGAFSQVMRLKLWVWSSAEQII